MYRRVMLPLDGSPQAEEVLPHALTLAKLRGAEVVLVRVLRPFPAGFGASEGTMRQAMERTREMASRYLGEVADRFAEEGIAAESVVLEGEPHSEILRFAEAKCIDMIMISARGRSGWSRWLMGSVADRVVRGASVSVLLVRGSGEGSESTPGT